MSPEQVRGQQVDARSDIFSLGVVLFEMLAGQLAFQGASAVELMNAILKEDPPNLNDLVNTARGSRERISPLLESVVRRCLEKRPEARFQSASDLAFALKSLSATSTAPLETPKKSRRRRWSALTSTGLAAAIIVAIAFGGVVVARPLRATRTESTSAVAALDGFCRVGRIPGQLAGRQIGGLHGGGWRQTTNLGAVVGRRPAAPNHARYR